MGRRVLIEVGEKYHRMTVIAVETRPDPAGSKHAWATCRCDCGTVKDVRAHLLRAGNVKSCGCWRRESMSQRQSKYGSGAKSHDPIYATWAGMKARCTNPSNPNWKNYGARGITIYEPWLDYLVFRAWAEANGYQQGLTIERINNDGNYEPTNCRFITIQEQQKNRRPQAVGTTGPKYTAWGESKTWREWELDDRVKVARQTFHARRRAGWDTEKSLTVPALRLRDYEKRS